MKIVLISVFLISLICFISIPDTFGITVPVNIPIGAAAVKNYEPSTVKIEIGDTIKWTVFDRGNNIRHTVTSNSGLFDSGYMTRPLPPNPPPTFEWTFNQGGTYNYHCKIHSWMTGSVIVNETGLNASAKDCSNLGCVYLEKERYGVSEDQAVLVKIYGELNVGGDWAYMTIKDPTGKITKQRVMVTSSGYFENPMSISYDKRGEYTVIVTRGDYHPNGNHLGTIIFEVVKLSASQQKDVTPSSMTLKTDSQRYEKGAIIGIAGQLIPYQSGTTDVTIMIRSQNGNVVEVAQVHPSSAGTFSTTFNTLLWISAGNYEVQAKYENLIKSTTFYLSVPSSSTSKTSTFLKLDSLDNTFKAQNVAGKPDPLAVVTFSGQLLTGDKRSYIPNSEIKFVFTGITIGGKDHYVKSTNSVGEFDFGLSFPIGKDYGVQAVYDGSSKFNLSKSQTESFTVMSATSPSQPSPPVPSSGGDPTSGIVILVIVSVIIGVVIAVIKSRKKTPIAPLAQQRRRRRSSSKASAQSSGGGSTAYRTYTCPKCGGGDIEQNSDGSEFCLACGWKN